MTEQADVGAIAEDTIRESAAAVPHPSGQARPGATPPAEPVDLDGRTFDPALHLAKADGTPRLRRGLTLIRRKGVPAGPLPPKVTPAAAPPPPPPTSGFLDLEAAGLGGEEAAPAAQPGAQAPVQPAVDPTARYKADAEVLREGVEALCRLIAADKGDLKPEDAKKLDLRWEEALADNGWALPIGKLTLAVWESVRNFWRAGTTEEGRARIKSAWDWLMGNPVPRREGKPQQPQRDQERPGKVEEPPQAPAGRPSKKSESRLEDVSI